MLTVRLTHRALALAVGAFLLGACERHEPLPAGAGSSAAAPTGDKITLAMHPSPGTHYQMAMLVEQHITQKVSGREQVLDQTIRFELTSDVLSVDSDGNNTARLTYTRMAMKQTGPGAMLDVDTDRKTPATGPAAVFAAMLGKGFRITSAPSGQVLRVQDADTLRKSIVASVPEASRSAVAAQLESMIGDEALKKQFGDMSAVYPDRPIDNGDTWTKSVNNGGPLAVRIDSTYKLLKHDAAQAVVGVTGVVGGINVSMSAVSADLKGNQSGTVIFDVPTGLVASIAMAQEISGTATAGGQSVPLTIRSKNTVTCTFIK